MSENNRYTVKESYLLPSKGKFYSKPVNPEVELRAMTVREEMRRMCMTNRPYKVLADIIDACLVTKLPISSYDMCLGDYEYLLHKLRTVSYGPSYNMGVICPRCGKVFETTINLDDLKSHEIDEKEINQLLSFNLPVCGKLITIYYQTPRILDEIELRKAEIKKKAKDLDYDPTLQITLQLAIDTIDGEKMGYSQLESFIDKLHVKDAKTIMDKIEEFNRKVGLDTKFESSCVQCGYDISTFFRFTDEFFRPKN